MLLFVRKEMICEQSDLKCVRHRNKGVSCAVLNSKEWATTWTFPSDISILMSEGSFWPFTKHFK